MALSSDEAVFGGYENASKKYNTEYQTQEGTYDNRPNSFQVTGLSVHRAAVPPLILMHYGQTGTHKSGKPAACGSAVD